MGLVRLDGLLFTWILYCTPPQLREVGPGKGSGNTLTYTRKEKNRNGGTVRKLLGD